MIGQNNQYNQDDRHKKRILWLLLLFLFILMMFVIWFYWIRKTNGDKIPEPPKVEVEVGSPTGDNPADDMGDTSSGNAEIDQTVELPVRVNTLGQTINAAEIHIKFDPNEIEVKEIIKNGSIFQYWIDNYSEFNNTTGVVTLIGSLPSPGFKGSGLVAVIKALPKKEGTATIAVEKTTQVAINDGNGTIAETVIVNTELEVKGQ